MKKSFREATRKIIANGGMIRTGEALRRGIHPRTLYDMRDVGLVVMEQRGLYRLSEVSRTAAKDKASRRERKRPARRVQGTKRLSTRKSVQAAIRVIRGQGGIIRTRDALKLGIAPRTLYWMRDNGILDTVSGGLYRIADQPPLSNQDLATVAAKIPNVGGPWTESIYARRRQHFYYLLNKVAFSFCAPYVRSSCSCTSSDYSGKGPEASRRPSGFSACRNVATGRPLLGRKGGDLRPEATRGAAPRKRRESAQTETEL